MSSKTTSKKKPGVLRSFALARKIIRAGWRPQTVTELDEWMERGGGYRSTSGMLVTQETANNFTAYFSGVLQISQTIGSCPLHIFSRVGKGKEIHVHNELNTRLSMMANPYQDAYRWKEQMQHHALNWGNGYSWIQRDTNEQIIALWPMSPDCTSLRLNDNNVPEYVYRAHGKPEKIYAWSDVFHLAGFGFDGLRGYSLLEIFQNAIGLGLAGQEFQGRFLANGAHIPGFFEHPKTLSDDAYERLKTELNSNYSGIVHAGKRPLLEEGTKYVPMNMPLKDAEFLGSRVFQIQEMARILNIPTPKLKEYSKLTYSNAEQLAIDYRTDTIRPWAERWEAAINFQLLTPEQQKTSFAEFDLNAIVRGDMKTEYAAYKEGRYGGWLNADEVRGRLGMNPMEDPEVGGRYWQPVNMVDAANPQPGQAEPEEPAEPTEPTETLTEESDEE